MSFLNLLPELDFQDPLRMSVDKRKQAVAPAPPSNAVNQHVLTPPASRPTSPAPSRLGLGPMLADLSLVAFPSTEAKFDTTHNAMDLDGINVSDLLDLHTPPASPNRVPTLDTWIKPEHPGMVSVPQLDSCEEPFDLLVNAIGPGYPTPYSSPYNSDSDVASALFAFSPEPSPAPAVPELPAKRRRKCKRPVLSDEEADDDDDYVPTESTGRKRRQGGRRRGRRSRDANSKRDSHNVSERQRRKELKNSFEALRMSVPCMVDNPRVHTGTILNNALDFIKVLEQEEKDLIAQKEALAAENRRLLKARA